jgi:hypothetical protein
MADERHFHHVNVRLLYWYRSLPHPFLGEWFPYGDSEHCAQCGWASVVLDPDDSANDEDPEPPPLRLA